MKAVVVYESMYGNTHLIADAIGEGLRTTGEAVVVSVHDADASLVAGADLMVVGGPTHVHGMSRPTTRDAAVAAADQPESSLTMDPDAEGPGVREWLESLHQDANDGGQADQGDAEEAVEAETTGKHDA